MRSDPTLLVCGVLCLYPLLLWALPAYLIGRYRHRFRSPIAVDRPARVTDPQYAKRVATVARKVTPPPTDDVGYGG